MLRFLSAIMLCLLIAVAGCTTAVPLWKDEAKTELHLLQLKEADKKFPAEYGSAVESLKKGDELLQQNDVEEADVYFRFSLVKGKILEQSLAELDSRRKEEARLRDVAEKIEMERLRAVREEERKAAEEKKEAEVRKSSEQARPVRERLLPDSHTVKRGETLPLIAARSDVYNDYRLWPLLYRANRDQIRDPRQIWPGQVLRIPRSVSREEYAEARRYAQERPIH